MVRNVFETHEAEALSWINLSSALWILMLGLVPSGFILFLKIEFSQKWYNEILLKVLSVFLSIFVIVFLCFIFNVKYLSFVRADVAFRDNFVPFSFVYNSSQYLYNRYVRKVEGGSGLGKDAHLVVRDGEKPVLMFFVVGESARARNFSMNGYRKNTNPFTSKIEHLLSYQDFHSCGTATAVSVLCLFSRMGRAELDVDQARRSEGLLDVVKRAGVSILWKENNGNCYGVCDRVASHYYYVNGENRQELCYGRKSCLDEGVLLGLDEDIYSMGKNSLMGKSKLVVFHIQGSHAPEYYKRYTEEFRYFSPECLTGDVKKCSFEALENTYDNSLVYTDKIIADMVDVLKKYQDEYNAVLLYVSDHGESLGENGQYFHGAPYDGAPEEQTHIPMQVWMSGGLIRDKGVDWACLQENAMTRRYSHDNLFSSILGLLDIQTEVYDSAQDIFRPCRSDGLRGSHQKSAPL